MTKLKKIHLLTGANLGDRFGNLEKAIHHLEERVGAVLKVSSLYETAAWGSIDQPNYLNQAIEMETKLPPLQLLTTIHEIEASLGRTRQTKWESRIIDIDVLFYAHLQITTEKLTIPHPRIHQRNFVLIPMLEIAPLKRHPVFKKSIEKLYLESEDELEVIMIEQGNEMTNPSTLTLNH